jgi:hypothetical protein
MYGGFAIFCAANASGYMLRTRSRKKSSEIINLKN